MKKRIPLTASLLLLATSFCHAKTHTLAEADTIIVILLFIVIALIVLGGFSLHYSRIISRLNEQLLRILNALDDYRAIVANGALSLDEQEEVMKKSQPKPKSAKTFLTDGSQAFYVKMDARVNKEKPFADPDFNQQSLAEFMEVDLDTFCQLCHVIRIPTGHLTTSTPSGRNTLQRYLWTIRTARRTILPACVASRMLRPSSAPSNSPLASRQRTI